jgi:hypothetical protein
MTSREKRPDRHDVERPADKGVPKHVPLPDYTRDRPTWQDPSADVSDLPSVSDTLPPPPED